MESLSYLVTTKYLIDKYNNNNNNNNNNYYYYYYYNNNEKKIYLIEITIPWIENRRVKYEFKCQKYINILQKLQFENSDFEVAQITLVMDVFGGYDANYTGNGCFGRL